MKKTELYSMLWEEEEEEPRKHGSWRQRRALG